MASLSPPSPIASRRLRTLHAQVVDELGRRIVGGGYGDGARLPPEDQLAAELGVSKGGLREAIKALSAKGLVKIGPRVGTSVTPRSDWNLFDPDVLNWHTDVPGAPLAEHLLELRLIVEPEAVRLACRRGDEATLTSIADANDSMQLAAKAGKAARAEFLAADLAFHQALLRASGNDLIAQLARLLAGALHQGFDITFHAPGFMQRTLPMHAAIAEAVGERDADAACAADRMLLLDTMRALAASRSATSLDATASIPAG